MFQIKTYYNCAFHTLNSAFDEKRKVLIVWKEDLKEELGWISAWSGRIHVSRKDGGLFHLIFCCNLEHFWMFISLSC